MTSTPVIARRLDNVLALAPVQDASVAPVTFSDLEQRSLHLLSDDVTEIIADTLETASALSAPGTRDTARRSLIAKAIASERARNLCLARQLDELLLCRDLAAVVVVDRLLNSSSRRLCGLLAEHRASSSSGTRTAIVVGHAKSIRVEA